MASCTNNKEIASTNNGKEEQTKQVATISVTQELNSIDPANTVDSNSNIALNNIYEGLYRLNEQNNPEPAGASQLPVITEDGLTYKIKLRTSAKWSNGDKVTAADYIFAWKRAIAAKNATENRYLYENIVNAEAVLKGMGNVDEIGIKALDPETLQIQLNRPMPYFTALLAIPAFFPLQEKYVLAQGDSFASDSDHALYNGPFTMVGYTGPGIANKWSYQKNPDYWDVDSVKMETINVEVIKETATNVNLFDDNKLDEVSITGEFAKNRFDSPDFVQAQSTQTIFLGYNQTQKMYQNQKIRQAFSLLLDRKMIADHLLGNGVKPATGLIFPDLFINSEGEDFTELSGNHLKKDQDQAVELWLAGKEEAGLLKEASVEIQLISFENEDMKKVAEYLKGEIDTHFEGAEVKINVYPVPVFMKNASNQEFDLYLVSWGADYPDPTSLFKLFKSDSSYNWGKYASKTYDDSLTKADQQDVLDEAKHWQNLLDVEKVLMDEQGITPLYFGASTYLRKEQYKGVIFHNVGPRFEYKKAYIAE